MQGLHFHSKLTKDNIYGIENNIHIHYFGFSLSSVYTYYLLLFVCSLEIFFYSNLDCQLINGKTNFSNYISISLISIEKHYNSIIHIIKV